MDKGHLSWLHCIIINGSVWNCEQGDSLGNVSMPNPRALAWLLQVRFLGLDTHSSLAPELCCRKEKELLNHSQVSFQVFFPLPMRNWEVRGEKGGPRQLDGTRKVEISYRSTWHAEGGKREYMGKDLEEEMKKVVARGVSGKWGLTDQRKCVNRGEDGILRSLLPCITCSLHV